jgi:hypothetical protein
VQLCDNARLNFGSHPAFIRQQAQTPTVVIHLKNRWSDQLAGGASWTAEYWYRIGISLIHAATRH